MIAFVTLTNDGYVDYTLNCYESLRNINSSIDLKSYCIGDKCFNTIVKHNYPCELLNDKINTNFQVFRTGNWSNITLKKFDIIYDNLRTYDYVLFTDGDIVYENNKFIHYLLEHIKDYDILIQNDTLDDFSTEILCTGFMFIKSNENTLKIFHPDNTRQYENFVGFDDQVYVNVIKNLLNFKLLPLNLFPNGQYYYNNYNSINPYIIHFNWVVGHQKKDKMLLHNKWYLGS